MKFKFGKIEEEIITRKDFSLKKARKFLSNETICVLGYGVQGPGQALNLRDNEFNVIVGQRKNSKSWDNALKDGWIENKTLFSIEEGVEKSTIIMFLLSDAGQIAVWPKIKKYLSSGKGLYFSHGFGLTFKKKTKIYTPKNIDIFLVAPKGSGTSLRRLFKEGKGLNSSYAINQDYTGKAKKRALSIGMGIGSAFLFETTFKKEVYSDLTGERGSLMGAIQGLFSAQYKILRENGHSPSEAFNETVEELTQSLMPLIAEKGMDWMYENCSTTAQRGALDWWKTFRDINIPLFINLYKEVSSGREAEKTILSNSKKNYRKNLKKELKEIKESELWKTGKIVRKLRP
ncbi:ketol-acid reductoisomerase [Candidatus Karelsulcia muelleri]|uniref:Ketol-acid reductoisomerase n=1 Tax=Candidatus Karelsulcia muelleri PSPU TaxID=1189303 RepID=A0AAD1EXI7_9FLAO|nr:ketol-acid reductoisomerase [Candidatus Karelsulcia muelleri]NJJ98778.1 ketol-acid reductoisomerase [Candidatus Karelsulcia muelleri]BAO66430.1 ketol-acid reductoisomerase [Candidatus Karelsulcia muelleri PSPU]